MSGITGAPGASGGRAVAGPTGATGPPGLEDPRAIRGLPAGPLEGAPAPSPRNPSTPSVSRKERTAWQARRAGTIREGFSRLPRLISIMVSSSRTRFALASLTSWATNPRPPMVCAAVRTLFFRSFSRPNGCRSLIVAAALAHVVELLLWRHRPPCYHPFGASTIRIDLPPFSTGHSSQFSGVLQSFDRDRDGTYVIQPASYRYGAGASA